ncbi:MAG: hypothetical protein ACRDLF_04675 [Solirubrobacteraceae bacterium]
MLQANRASIRYAIVAAVAAAGLACLCALSAPASAETCPNEAYRTGPGANLPDCRAYELVTPPFKEAALARLERRSFILKGYAGISVDGSHVDVVSVGNFGDAHSSLAGNSYELTRTQSGWSETNIDLPASQFPENEPIAATPDLGTYLYEARTTSQPEGAKDFWLREADGALHDVGPFSPPSSESLFAKGGVGEGGFEEVGAGFRSTSADLSHVLFTIEGDYWPGDTTVGERISLYEYVAGQGGPPALVGVDSSGHQIGQCGDEYDAMSEDGSAVFFEVAPSGCEPNAAGPPVNEVFARIGESRTVAISEPSQADCSACDTSPATLAAATFNAASADGSKVFFTTTQPLLGSDTSANIYEYDFDAPATGAEDPDGRIIQVSGGNWGAQGAQVQGVVKVSEDGSHVYFVAQGALSGAANSQGQLPTEGGENLYVFERDAQFPEGRTSFIATLSPSDSQEWSNVCIGEGCYATATPDGRFLAFTSHADLTPDDTSTAKQVFRYDAQTGDLVRVSIGQNGFNNDGNTNTFGASIPPLLKGSNEPLAMSNDGEYIAFESADGLTPLALNGFVGEYVFEEGGEKFKGIYYANNVYEYHDGNVYLISDGQDTTPVHERTSSVRLRGMSPSGHDIFFETADRLVPQDLDTQIDVYDARIDGGFPAPVSLLPSCSGDACQGQLSAAPVLLSPGSEFQAGGNPPLASPAPATKARPKAKAKGCGKGLGRKKRHRCGGKRAKRAAKTARRGSR